MNEYEVPLNQTLCGFNFIVIFLIILVAYIWILVILRLRCHIENPSIEDTASLHKLATGRKLATTHLNVSNRQMCGCTGFKSGSYNKSYYNRPFKNDTGL